MKAGGRTPRQEQHLVELHRGGQHTSAELAELFGVARATVYRALQRAGASAPPANAYQALYAR